MYFPDQPPLWIRNVKKALRIRPLDTSVNINVVNINVVKCV